MLLIREVFHCRPGKVRPLLEKFQAMNRIMANAGQTNMRLMTDFSGERYWTLVAEFETPSMAEFEKMMQGGGMSEADTKEFERLMEGYHDPASQVERHARRLPGERGPDAGAGAGPSGDPGAVGLSASLLDELDAAIKEFDASLQDTNQGRQNHVAARAEMKALSDDLMRLVGMLDGFNRYRFHRDRELIVAWESAKHVVTGPQPKESELEVPPAAGLEPAA